MAIAFGHGELQGEMHRILHELDARLEALEKQAAEGNASVQSPEPQQESAEGTQAQTENG